LDYSSKNADERVVLICFQKNFLIEERAVCFSLFAETLLCPQIGRIKLGSYAQN